MKKITVVGICMALLLTGLTGCAGIDNIGEQVNDIEEFVDEATGEAEDDIEDELEDALEDAEEDAEEQAEDLMEDDHAAVDAEVEDTEAASEDSSDSAGNTVNVTIPESELSAQTISFTSTTLDGEPVDESIFADYDITVVHVWGTFCGPCIAEMGEYASMYEEIPDNVNLVGMICDVYEGDEMNVDDAHEILSDAGAKFTNLRTSESLYNLTASLGFVPSSFFVDREGHLIGKMLDGADFDMTLEQLDSYIE
ncbi:MAG: TlpA family protein disulfide reductase [Lachnospiraceae bacterium]|nr:TlpA family protein disulfide reductase [Lachnospiraceae bacterium]